MGSRVPHEIQQLAEYGTALSAVIATIHGTHSVTSIEQSNNWTYRNRGMANSTIDTETYSVMNKTTQMKSSYIERKLTCNLFVLD